MNKKTIIIVVVAILATAIVVGGGVYFLTNKNKTSTNTTSSNTTTSNNSNKAKSGNEIVQAVLDKVKANTPTVTAVKIINEQNDTNNAIGKQGQYQYRGDFYDTRTNSTTTAEGDYGVSEGGAIEVYANENYAKARGDYLSTLQTGLIQAGGYRVVGINVLRVSENYTASQQQEMLNLMESAL